ncbi:MAG: type III pantothenate kinase [Gammaproteobacteria bacterium]|jgi:type III pantothenate kinase|nr:type III pantothenate kinase [Gammaproteobacteria bacterium]MBT7306910.1 type III pantothenate kinase [Gammaproteobacteria bacterium]
MEDSLLPGRLLVDAGNSRIKWRVQGEAGATPVEVIDNGAIERVLQRAWSEIPQPTEVWLCNSAGAERAEQISAVVSACWGLSIETARSETRLGGVVNGYYQPSQLGVDRWLGMVAVWQRSHSAFCLVDCGTAITIDLVNGLGEHQGGVILPGFDSNLTALLQRAPHLTPAAPLARSSELGRSTEEGLSGYEGDGVVAVERIVKQLRQQYSIFQRVVTGGEAERLTQSASIDYWHWPDLVLDGLWALSTGSLPEL